MQSGQNAANVDSGDGTMEGAICSMAQGYPLQLHRELIAVHGNSDWMCYKELSIDRV